MREEGEGLVTIEEIRRAADRALSHVHRTPLLTSRLLSERVGAPLVLKAENLQKAGSFKLRGALTRMAEVEEEARSKGVVTVSAGNHAQAVALAASALSLPSRVVMPEDAPRAKVAAAQGYGGTVVLRGTVFDSFEEALRISRDEGAIFVHPFDDRAVIAGQGTVGLEIVEEVPRPAAVVVPVGGGGLLAGVAAAVRALSPETPIFGVEPTGAASMHRSLEEGRPIRLSSVDTIADGLASPMAGERTFRHVRELVEEVVTVDDDDLRRALTLILSRCKLLVEPAGAAAVAALLTGRIRLPSVPGAGPVVAILSGGNLDMDRLPSILLP